MKVKIRDEKLASLIYLQLIAWNRKVSKNEVREILLEMRSRFGYGEIDLVEVGNFLKERCQKFLARPRQRTVDELFNPVVGKRLRQVKSLKRLLIEEEGGWIDRTPETVFKSGQKATAEVSI